MESTDEYARLGSAFHKAIAAHVLNKDVSLHGLASEFQVELEDLSVLYALGRQCWDQWGVLFPNPVVEYSMSERGELGLTGMADIVSVVDGQVRIPDWKTEWGEAQHEQQMRGYAYLACKTIGVDRAWVGLIRVRDRSIDATEYTIAELEDWYAAACNKMQAETLPYVPGPACMYCPRSAACPAKANHLAISSAIFRDVVENTFPMVDFSDADLCDLHARLGQFRLYAEKTAELVKAEVIRRGGKIDGLEIKRQKRAKIDAIRGWPILSRRLGDDLLKCVKVGKGDVEDALRAIAPPRGKAKLVAEVMESLADAGAITRTETEILVARKPLTVLPAAGGFSEQEATEITNVAAMTGDQILGQE